MQCDYDEGHYVQEILCNDFSYLDLFIQPGGTICAILVDGLSLNLFEFGPVIQKEMPCKDISFCI